MNKRKLELGDRNVIGTRVTQARLELGLLQKDLVAKLQVQGIDISLTAFSLLEGQKRPVFDYELLALARILNKEPNWFFESDDENV